MITHQRIGKWWKPVVWTLAVVVGLAWGYWHSYSTAAIHLNAQGDRRLILLGISLPWNDVSKTAFVWGYTPLIAWETGKSPRQEVQGSVLQWHAAQGYLTVIREERDRQSLGVAVHVPDHLRPTVAELRRNEPVRLFFKSVPFRDDPFLLVFELISVTRVNPVP